MYSVAAIKAFVTVTSLGLGIGAVALTVGIQRNPRLFTSPEPQVIEARYVPREMPAPAPPVAAVTIPEVQISAAPQTFEVKSAVKQTTQRFATPKRPSAPAPKAQPANDPSKDRVIPAPCVSGEYRKLDEQQGVRLMCPGDF